MNARRLNYLFGLLIIALVVCNVLTIRQLRRQREELGIARADFRKSENIIQKLEWQMKDTRARGVAPMTATQSVSIVLGEMNEEHGLRQVYDQSDGITAPAMIDGVPCRELTRPGELAKIHFTIDESFKSGTPMRAWLEVEYFDAAVARDSILSVEYDGPRAYTPSEYRVRLKNDSVWKKATFELTEATFTGRENGGADFRIIASKPKVFVRRVILKKE